MRGITPDESKSNVMAEKLDTFPQKVQRVERKYPWRQWTDGSIWKAKQGEDFTCEPNSFVSSLRAKASNPKLRVKVLHGSEKTTEGQEVALVIFQFWDAATDTEPK